MKSAYRALAQSWARSQSGEWEVAEDAADSSEVRAPVSPTGSSDKPLRHIGRRPVPLAIIAVLIPMALLGVWLLVAPPAPPEPSRPYILVVPFGVCDNATEYHRTFADQLTREVSDSLRKVSGLKTVPQASAFQFRDDRTREHVLEPLPDLQFLLDGEVSVAPDGPLRITPRLADLRQDLDVWNSAFTVRVDDRNFFETPAEVARAVAAALKVEVLAGVQDHEALIDSLSLDGDGVGGIKVVTLDADRDGLEQISSVLADHSDLAAVHILSHGTSGSLQLGNGNFTQSGLAEHAGVLAGWGRALAEDGDLLLYGCRLPTASRASHSSRTSPR